MANEEDTGADGANHQGNTAANPQPTTSASTAESDDPSLMKLAQGVAISFAVVVVIGLGLMTTFALQVFPFAPKPIETCQLVDKVSDLLGQERDPKAAVIAFGKLLGDTDVRRAVVICDIERHNVWYSRMGLTNQILSSIGVVMVIVLTLATSFILGVGWADRSRALKTVAIALPLISASITALMSEFRLSDVWQLRELGRIESKILRDKAFFLDSKSPGFDRQLAEIRDELTKLERNQAQRYFAYKFRSQEESLDEAKDDAADRTKPADAAETNSDPAPAQK